MNPFVLLVELAPVAEAVASLVARYNASHKANAVASLTEAGTAALASNISALAQLQQAAVSGQPLDLNLQQLHPTLRDVVAKKLAEAGLDTL